MITYEVPLPSIESIPSFRSQEAKKLDRLQSEANQLTAVQKKEQAEALLRDAQSQTVDVL